MTPAETKLLVTHRRKPAVSTSNHKHKKIGKIERKCQWRRLLIDARHLSWDDEDFVISIMVLLMVQKSHSQPPFRCIPNLVNNGINYQPSTGEFTGFLNHQQVLPLVIKALWKSRSRSRRSVFWKIPRKIMTGHMVICCSHGTMRDF